MGNWFVIPMWFPFWLTLLLCYDMLKKLKASFWHLISLGLLTFKDATLNKLFKVLKSEGWCGGNYNLNGGASLWPSVQGVTWHLAIRNWLIIHFSLMSTSNTPVVQFYVSVSSLIFEDGNADILHHVDSFNGSRQLLIWKICTYRQWNACKQLLKVAISTLKWL